MQASDYSSAARSLAHPISSRSSSPSSSRASPAHSRPRRSRSRDHGQSSHRASWQLSDPEPPLSSRYTAKVSQLLTEGKKLQRHGVKQFKKLARWQQIGLILFNIALGVLGVLFLVFNEKIFAWLVPIAKRWRDTRGGWLLSWAFTFVCAFPPIVGYSMSLTVAGFVFGFPKGWLIAATANIAGSFCSFLLCRYWLSSFSQRLVVSDKRFAALAHTLKQDGFKLLVMIRLCPLPYSLSNGAMATFPTVSAMTYAAATAAATPKLMIHIFIGGRIASLAESGGKMDFGTKLINYTSIVLGVLLGIGTGYIIYNKAMRRSAELEAEEQRMSRSDGSVSSRNVASRYSEQSLVTMAEEEGIEHTESKFAPSSQGRGRPSVPAQHAYSDDFSDDELDVFAQGDGDVEQGKQLPGLR